MRVSVVIAAYNAADYLREAIQSALDQTSQPFEIVVIDDGSTDHTREVCASFGSRVRYIYQAQDGTMGASAQLRGILESTGELIAFLDHDDRWLPTKLEKQLRALESNPEAGAVFTGYQNINEKGDAVGAPIPVMPSGDVFHELLSRSVYCHSSALVRRSAFARGGLQNIDAMVGDWDQWLRIARHHMVASVDECLTQYRVHGDNFSRNLKRQALGSERVLLRHKGRLHPNCRACRKAFRQSRRFIKRCLARYYLDCYYDTILNGRFFSALPPLVRALGAAPAEVLRPRRLLAVIKNGFRPAVKALRGEKTKALAG